MIVKTYLLCGQNSDNLKTPQRLNFVAPQYNLGGQTSGESAVWTHFLIV